MHRDESLARSNEIDQICDEFEQACRAGHARRIEEVLAENIGVDRSRLLRELLLIELEIRQQKGEPASADDYVDRFPSDTDVVDAAVETILLRHDPEANEETVDVSMNAGEETYVPGDAAGAETIVPGSNTEPGQESNDATSGKQFGDYELLHEIARGGMGVVYKARQTKLNRIVALKMIKSGELAGDEEVKRFHAEAEAAAALDHPGIVPIYEVGRHNDQHFFSMGFVDGAGLDAQLKEGPLPPKDAAGLIKTIAEAVQYAHDKGIVHRDLKPANVLLADNTHPVDAQSGAAQQNTANQREPGRAAPGHNDTPTTAIEKPPNAARAGTARHFVPKITDFGLAKNIAGDSGMTATGQVLGTPSYMPPEQAAGKIEQVGPLADVYSLGAMLYATLTGRPPFQSANVMETLKQVLEREPVSPSQLNPAVDKDLETIVLKCLEKDAAKRYPTARDFASDLDCFLTGKPISARPISRPARVWRWCKRNPLGATVAGLLLFLAIAGPAVAVHQIETNRQLDNALSGEKIATATAQQKERETATALAKVKVALASEQAALKRKDKALLETEKSIDAYVEVVKNAKLLKEPRFKPLLKDLLKDALAHYERFIEEHKDEQDEKTRGRLVTALFEIGSLNDEQGSPQEAIKAYRQALKIETEMARQNPAASNHQFALASIHSNLGSLYLATGNTDEAATAHQQALKIRERLVRENPTKPEYQFDLATSHFNLGTLHQKTGRTVDARAAYTQAMKIQERFARQNPTMTKYQHALASSHNNLGALYQAAGKLDEATSAHQHALKIWVQLARKNPAITKYQDAVATGHRNLGVLYNETGKTAEARTSFQQSLKVQEQLTLQHPTVTRYQADLASTCNNLGAIHQATGQISEAEKAHQQALKIQKQLVRDHPTVTSYQQNLASSQFNLGNLYQAIGKEAEAVAAYREALKLREQLARNNPAMADDLHDLSVSHFNLGVLYQKTGQIAEAVAAYHQTLKIGEQLARDNPGVPKHQHALSVGHFNLGVLYQKTGKLAEAAAAFQQALKIRKQLARDNPKVTKYRSDLASSYSNLANLFQATGRLVEAEAAHQQALQIQEQLTRENSTHKKHQFDLAASHHNLGTLYRSTGNTAKATAAYQHALTIREQLARDNPQVTEYLHALAASRNNLGALYQETGRTAEARVAYQRALKILEQLARTNSTVTEYQNTLGSSHFNLGNLYQAGGMLAEAESAYRKALKIRERLAQANPELTEFQNALAGTHINLGRIYRATGKTDKSLESLDKAIRVLSAMSKRNPNDPTTSLYLRLSYGNRAMSLDGLSRYREAADDWRKALALVPGAGAMREFFQRKLIFSLSQSGQHAEATGLAAQLLKVTRSAPAIYEMTCVFAVSAGAAKSRAGDAENNKRRATRHAEQAIVLLKALAKAGFFKLPGKRPLLREDPDLNPLRPRDDFRAFAKSVGVTLPAWARKPASATTVAAP